MIKINMTEIGSRIKLLRLKKKLSQTELANRIGVAPNTVTQYEKGTSKISIDVLVNLVEVLETTADYLLGLTD